ncbi:MAG: helix-turn-helix transcriptional regulator [candidate division Zixibacteria bacterium]|nr:helix-turn-helix transcriptional regulator [candidate division Zixibacteria bacterium]
MSHDSKPIKSNQIRRYREKRCLRQRDVLKLVGLQHPSNLYRWETGDKIPTLKNALKLSAALQCPVELLFLDQFKQIRQEMYPERAEQ